MPTNDITVLGIAGSLRRGSFNRSLLEAAAELAPEGVRVIQHDIAGLPLYNADLDDDAPPAAATELKAAIGAADAVLWATPEYNYGVATPLKNALDWASRPGYRSVLANKPVGMMGASISAVGTARAQAHLKGSLLGVLSLVYPAPEVLVSGAEGRFVDGALVDEKTRHVVARYLAGFAAFARGMRELRERGVFPPPHGT